MGAAPETLQEAELTPQEARDTGQEWFLDTETGQLKPEWSSDAETEDLPRPVRVARWIFD
ncbi:hypothetical protein ABH931_007073 [Streptacidiphilus sp. MAP12-33]|uniref:hypothetical protein n=1 Tax=Streptacidiphilus sp. MAP12-33 TaxID=3156266 RepID=UPI0035173138